MKGVSYLYFVTRVFSIFCTTSRIGFRILAENHLTTTILSSAILAISANPAYHLGERAAALAGAGAGSGCRGDRYPREDRRGEGRACPRAGRDFRFPFTSHRARPSRNTQPTLIPLITCLNLHHNTTNLCTFMNRVDKAWKSRLLFQVRVGIAIVG